MFADRSYTLHMIPEERLYADVLVRRLFAWVFDTLATLAIVALLIPLTGFLALFFLGGLYLAVNFLYRWLGMARHSATLGMRLMGLTFRDAMGQPISGLTGFLHTLFYTLSVAFVFPQVISVALMIFSRSRQGLSDIVLATALVNERALRG